MYFGGVVLELHLRDHRVLELLYGHIAATRSRRHKEPCGFVGSFVLAVELRIDHRSLNEAVEGISGEEAAAGDEVLEAHVLVLFDEVVVKVASETLVLVEL